jgi:NAD(P)-dependent dehydrogenase (short-subunit alcohol dehydrogenase family)
MSLCEGRVAIVTGAGRGLVRAHALKLAEHGAKVVVNDLGSTASGDGSDALPAQAVVDEIVAAGGQAVVDGADVASFEARPPSSARRSIPLGAWTSSSTTRASCATACW